MGRIKKLKKDDIKLYEKLLKHNLTVPGFLPMGDGMAYGTWDDVKVFDPDTFEYIGFPVMESITHQICDRALAIMYNMKYAGLTEGQHYPEEFTEEAMAIKKKYRKKWKKSFMKFYPSPDHDGCSQLMHSGERPRKLIRAHPVERGIIRSGVKVELTEKDWRLVVLTFNVRSLSLAFIEKNASFIRDTVSYCKRATLGKSGKKFIPIKKKGYLNSKNSHPLNEYEFTLTDEQCVKIQKSIMKTRNTMSNRLFISEE